MEMTKRQELLEEALEEAYEAVRKLTPGSDERKKAEDTFIKLYSLGNDEKRIEFEEYVQEMRIEADKEVKMKDIRVKISQIEEDKRRNRRPSTDTILICSVTVGLTLGIYMIEGRGVLTPKALKHVEKLARFLKV